MSALETETLYYGDCLDWMQRWDDASVDLIYLDPPFNSKANYNQLFSSEGGGDAQYRAFSDTWTWDEAAADRYAAYEGALGRSARDAIVGLYGILGPSGMLAYLTYMAERLEQMHRLLKLTGSIYLHCDPTASHYLKLVMDAIFGAACFRNEITWKRTPFSGSSKARSRQLPKSHDVVLAYSKSKKWTWNPPMVPYTDEYRKRFRHTDTRGSYRKTLLKTYSEETLQRLREEDRLIDPVRPGAHYSYKQYLHESPGQRQLDDVWLDINMINPVASERLGYPTQKPVALLERIVKASSNEGDIVLDPFCGCGTTIDAARRLNRRWVGVDISSFAIDLIREKRLKDPTIPTRGIPTDIASARKLARERPFDFESWAVTRLPGFAPNAKQIGDSGVDGRAVLAAKPDNYDSRLALAQIKGGKFSLSTLRDFIHVTRRDKAALGCYVTLDPVMTKAATAEIVNTGKISVSGYPYPRMQIWPVAHYFEQRLPNLPIMNDPYTGKPMDQGTLF